VPTRRGKILIAEGLLLYVLARALAIRELFPLALAAVLFPFVAVAFVRWSRHRVGFRRTISPPRVFAGSTVRIEYSVHNSGRMSSPPLVLDDAAAAGIGGAIQVSLPSLPPDKRGSITVERTVGRRGWYSIGPMRARVVDPFGLAEMTGTAGTESRLVVYPRVEMLHESSPPEPRSHGGRSHIHRLASSSQEFYAVREWQDGDDLRRIHWRSTARRGSLMIRQDEIRPHPRATVLLDTRTEGDDELEWMITFGASVLWELARQGYSLRLCTPDVAPTSPRWGKEATDPLLMALAGISRSRVPSAMRVVRQLASPHSAGGVLIAILPPLHPHELGALARLRRQYTWAGAVFLDSISFEDGSSRERARFDQQLAEAERALARGGWRVVVAGSNDHPSPIWQSLLASGTSHPKPASLPS